MKTIRTSTARRAGKRDGRPYRFTFSPPFKEPKTSNPPISQSIPVEYENSIRGSAEASLARVSKAWHGEDKILHANFCKAVNHRQTLLHLSEEIRRDYGNAKAIVERLRTIIEGFMNPRLSPRWGTFFLLAVGISEFFLNSSAFQILGEARLMTFGIAAGMGLGLPLLAHFWGKSLKQENPTPMDLKIRAWAPILAFILIVSVSLIRAMYFAGTVGELSGLHPWLLAILLMGINTFLCALAVKVAYEMSRSQEAEYRTTRDKLLKAEARFMDASEKVAALNSNLASVENEIIETRHKREKRFQEVHDDKDEIIASYRFLVETYRRANLTARNDRPLCFNYAPIDPAVPPNLVRISWNCNPLDITMEVNYAFKNSGDGTDNNISSILLPSRAKDQ
ncbi:MAG TPA: hypothetical protein VLX91_05905 [Candidatus Acidoferrales bacterium]|nr:hypothetical protein [Candidatus Acidoferrales bacterium]